MHDIFSKLSSSPFQMKHVLHPSRIQHNGDTGADVQQGPVARILFRLRPCVNLFYCLLLAHTLLVLKMTKRDTGIICKLIIRRSKIDVKRAITNVFLRSMLSPHVCVKTGGSRVGAPDLCVLG